MHLDLDLELPDVNEVLTMALRGTDLKSTV